jgi:hypothetical protein
MLDIQRVEEPSSHDTWLTARVDDKPELGAYIPADLHHGAAPVSVFWRGEVGWPWLSAAVDRAETLLQEQVRGEVQAILIGFGSTRKEMKRPPGGRLSSYVIEYGKSDEFQAYRADFQWGADVRELSIWANVAESDRRSLGEGGENVGIALSSTLFTEGDYLRNFISREISATRGLNWEAAVTAMFDAVQKEIGARNRR